MKFLQTKPKTREEITLEIDNILNKKDKSMRGRMLYKSYQTIMVMNPQATKESIRNEFIEAYIKKYGELVTGKKSLDNIKKEAENDIQNLKNQLGKTPQ